MMLDPIKVKPGKIGPKDKRVNGYVLQHFDDAFERYLEPETGQVSPEGASEADTRTPPDNLDTSGTFEPDTSPPVCPVSKSQKPAENGQMSGCPVEKGVSGEKTYVWPASGRLDDIPYDGPVVPVPDLGPDPLDEHGATKAASPH